MRSLGRRAAPRCGSSRGQEGARRYFRFRGIDVEQSFAGFADRPTFADARGVAAAVAAPFVDGEVQQVLLVSTRFLSAGSQVVETRQLLPLDRARGRLRPRRSPPG